MPEWAIWTLVAIATLRTVLVDSDRIIGTVGRLGMLPSRLKHLDRERAHKIVDADNEREQLAALVAMKPMLEMLIKEVTPNGGESFRDQICALRDDIVSLREWHEAHERRHGTA